MENFETQEKKENPIEKAQREREELIQKINDKLAKERKRTEEEDNKPSHKLTGTYTFGTGTGNYDRQPGHQQTGQPSRKDSHENEHGSGHTKTHGVIGYHTESFTPLGTFSVEAVMKNGVVIEASATPNIVYHGGIGKELETRIYGNPVSIAIGGGLVGEHEKPEETESHSGDHKEKMDEFKPGEIMKKQTDGKWVLNPTIFYRARIDLESLKTKLGKTELTPILEAFGDKPLGGLRAPYTFNAGVEVGKGKLYFGLKHASYPRKEADIPVGVKVEARPGKWIFELVVSPKNSTFGVGRRF